MLCARSAAGAPRRRNATLIHTDISAQYGGAIAVQEKGCLRVVRDSAFTNNTALKRGGAIFIENPSCAISINNTAFESNFAGDRLVDAWQATYHADDGFGGGAYMEGLAFPSASSVTYCTFTGNTAQQASGCCSGCRIGLATRTAASGA